MRKMQLLVFAYLFAMVGFGFLSVSDFTTIPEPISAGSNGVIQVEITNSGSLTANVKIESSSTKPLIASSSQTIGDIEPGGTTKIAIPVRIEKTADTGIYTVQMTIYGRSQSSTSSTVTSDLKTVLVPVRVIKKPLITVNSSNLLLSKDVENSVSLGISNLGGKAINMRIAISSNNFIQLNENPIQFSELNGSRQLDLGIYVVDALQAGSYMLPLNVSYQDPLGNSYTDTIILPVRVAEKKSRFTVEAVVSEAILGTNNDLPIKIINKGDEKAYNVRVKLIGDKDITPIGSSEIDLRDMDIKAEQTVPFRIAVAQTSEGYRTIVVEISYEDKNGNQKTDRSNLGLKLGGKLDIAMYADTKPSPMVEKKEHTLSAVVSNAGNSKIRGLEVKIVPDDSLLVLDSTTSQFIGSLEEDDFSSVQFKVFPKQAGTTKVQIVLSYQDVFNVRHNETRDVELKVYSIAEAAALQPAQDSPLGIILLGCAFVAIGYWYFRMRKKPVANVK